MLSRGILREFNKVLGFFRPRSPSDVEYADPIALIFVRNCYFVAHLTTKLTHHPIAIVPPSPARFSKAKLLIERSRGLIVGVDF